MHYQVVTNPADPTKLKIQHRILGGYRRAIFVARAAKYRYKSPNRTPARTKITFSTKQITKPNKLAFAQCKWVQLTWRFRSSPIREIWIFFRPIFVFFCEYISSINYDTFCCKRRLLWTKFYLWKKSISWDWIIERVQVIENLLVLKIVLVTEFHEMFERGKARTRTLKHTFPCLTSFWLA